VRVPSFARSDTESQISLNLVGILRAARKQLLLLYGSE
jgi:hypothetical protein